MAATAINRTGFGQVEPNQVIGIITAEFIDTIPADSSLTVLEQGMFLQMSADGSKLVLPGAGVGPVVMVYNEEHFYDERDGYHKDYAMKQADFIDKVLVPRCVRPVELDVLTTNTFAANTGDKNTKVTGISLSKGDTVGVKSTGYFCAKADEITNSPEWVVTKIYTMPDGQVGAKLRCVSR